MPYKFSSAKFWVALVGAVVVAISQTLDARITFDNVMAVTIAVLTAVGVYLKANKIKDLPPDDAPPEPTPRLRRY